MIQIFFICCKNICTVSDFHIWSKSSQIETSFPLLYPTLLICIIHSCGSRTWIIRFSPLFAICKPYLTNPSLGVCQNRNLHLGAISRRLFSQESSIFDKWQGPKYASAYNKSIFFSQLKQCHMAEDFPSNTISGIFSHFQWHQFGTIHTGPWLNLCFCGDTIPMEICNCKVHQLIVSYII